jgi:hypothetical protein
MPSKPLCWWRRAPPSSCSSTTRTSSAAPPPTEGSGFELPRLAKPFRQADLTRGIAQLLTEPAGDTIKFPIEWTRR